MRCERKPRNTPNTRIDFGRATVLRRPNILAEQQFRPTANQLQFVLAFGVEELVGAGVIRFRHEDLRGTAQIAVVRRGGIHELLRGGDAMFLQHHHEHLGVDDRAGVKQFHAENLTGFIELKRGQMNNFHVACIL